MRLLAALVAAGSTVLASGLAAQAVPRGADPGVVAFTVRVTNVSGPGTLKLASGGSVDVPLSPVVWAVHSGSNPLLTPGVVENGLGLKGLAEAGSADTYAKALEAAKLPNVVAVGFANRPVGAAEPNLLEAGARYEFEIRARPGDRLSLAMMNGQSNDGLFANGRDGIPLFEAGKPVAGDVTARLSHWDAGTEVNEEPGAGRNQGMRQGAPHAGDPERAPVRPMAETTFGSSWPPVARMVRVTITPAR